MHTAVFKMDNQQWAYCTARGTVLCYVAAWMVGGLGENGYMCMYG